MEIREFVFRAMHDDPEDLSNETEEKARAIRAIRNSEIKNDGECREICAKFLYTEIALDGFGAADKLWVASAMSVRSQFLNLAEQFITEIIPSDTFMHDALYFFTQIREGRI